MGYKEKYEKALEFATAIYRDGNYTVLKTITTTFPELEGIRNEKIRSALIRLVKQSTEELDESTQEEMLDWLDAQNKKKTDPRYKYLEDLIAADDIHQMSMNDEMVKEAKDKAIAALSKIGVCELLGFEKQCEQPTDKVETKFKEGDYIVLDNITSSEIWRVINIDKDGYYNIQCITNPEYDEIYRIPGFVLEKDYRLWTIQDAKDGDVLVDEDNNIGLYLEKDNLDWHSCVYLGCDNCLRGFYVGGYHKCKNTKPATKEQRDLLFQKMADAGYGWDSKKKELKKVEVEMLDADKVIEWLRQNNCTACWDDPNEAISQYIERFKKDFGL